MRICLINPPWTIKKGNIWKYIRSTMPPIGLLYIAAVLEEDQKDVDIIDFQAERSNWKDVEETIKGRGRYDYYGITISTTIANNGYRVSNIIKNIYPETVVLFGGVHATAIPNEPFYKGDADFVVRGEGEYVTLRLINSEEFDTIDGLSFKKENRILHRGQNGIVNDLDSLPFPAYHKIKIKNYKPAVGAYKRLPAMNMLSTRGCPGKCTFCNSAKIPIRKRSAQNIFLEMKILSEQYGIKEISFYDDTFTTYRRNVTRLCDLLIENKIDLTWCCFARADTVSEIMLNKMKEAGCHQVMYGIESADKNVLRNIRKNIDHQKTINAIKNTKKAGLTVRCTFMMGNPGETVESLEETIKYSIKLNPDIALYNITTPYPGTEMYAWAKNQGYLKKKSWEEYDLSEPIMSLPSISDNEIKRKYRQAFKRFYLRPKYIFKRLRDFIFLKDAKIYIEAFKSYFGFIVYDYKKRFEKALRDNITKI